VVNEVWRKHDNKAKPSFVLDFKLPAGMFDVNVTPDKREIVLVEESRILERLRAALEELYSETHHTSSLTQDVPKLSQLSFAPSAAAFLANFTQPNASLSQSAQGTASGGSSGGNDILTPPATPSFSQSQPSTSSSPAAVRTSLSPNGVRLSPSTPSSLQSPPTPPQPKATSWVSQSEKALLQTAYNAAVARASAKGERDPSSPAADKPSGKRPRPSPPHVQLLITDEDDFAGAEAEDEDNNENVVTKSPAHASVAAARASSSSESARSSKRKATTSSSSSSSCVDILAEQPVKQQKQAPKPTTSDVRVLIALLATLYHGEKLTWLAVVVPVLVCSSDCVAAISGDVRAEER
jgi:DNA mismatch repair ATPase MutL